MATPTYIALATTTLGASASSVTFSSIPATYRDLVLVVNGRSAYTANAFESLQGRFNSDTGSNYSYVYMAYSPTSASGTGTSLNFGRMSNSNGGNTGFSTNVVSIMDYSATDKHKTTLARGSSAMENISPSADASRWANTAAVHTLTLTTGQSSTFVAGSTFSLYGIEA